MAVSTLLTAFKRNDKEFSEIELRATIVQQQARWPAPYYLFWQRLHAAADEARECVARAWAAMDEIENDADLNPEGKKRQKRKLALGLEKSQALASAKKAVEKQVSACREDRSCDISLKQWSRQRFVLISRL